MNVGSVCSRQIVSVALGAPLSEVARLMYERGCGAVIVTQSPADESPAEVPVVAGILTDRDLVRAQLSQVADFSQLNAADTMTRDPLVVSECDDIEQALCRLRAGRVRRAPVLAADGRLVGMVSTDDLLRQIARDLNALAGIVAHQSSAPANA